MKISKLPSGSYSVNLYYKIDGKSTRRRVTAATKDECRRLAADILASARASVAASVGDLISDYIGLKSPVLSPSTLRGYLSINRALSLKYPDFYTVRADKISDKMLQQLVNSLSADGLSRKTCKNYTDLIYTVLSNAGLSLHYPTLPARIASIPYIPSVDDIKALLDASIGSEMWVVLMLACTGPLRRGEITALTMDDIGDDGSISITKSHASVSGGGYIVKDYPKTPASVRVVTFSPAVIAEIKKRGYVTKMSPSAVSTAFIRLRDKLGLPAFRFHDLRHFAVSYLHAHNVPDAYIQSRGGWARSDGVMKSVYLHVLSSERETISRVCLDAFSDAGL